LKIEHRLASGDRPVERSSPAPTREVAAMSQEQTKRTGGGDDDESGVGTDAAGTAHREKLAGDTDDLLDEIDDVLEENAEDFVRAYVQKGGQ
jgi:prokaryotic ubiquitin-like protein Pup